MTRVKRWRQDFFSVVYFISKTSFGFLVHPYLTLPALVRQRQSQARILTLLLVLTPGVYYAGSVLIWRLGLRELVGLFVQANCPTMIIKTGAVFFAAYWQLSLLYLWGKFTCWGQKGGDEHA